MKETNCEDCPCVNPDKWHLMIGVTFTDITPGWCLLKGSGGWCPKREMEVEKELQPDQVEYVEVNIWRNKDID